MSQPYHLFQRFGVELEYMIVDGASLDVRPISDKVLAAQAGCITGDVEFGNLEWSNELVLHVIEIRTGAPAEALTTSLASSFDNGIRRINELLAPMGARLMPTSMHPWMDPSKDMKLWPHDYGEVYAAFDRIFDCRGHGWSNLQSVHLNLPFFGDEEFGRLHAAIRLLLPIMPALAASSPIMDGSATGLVDTRLEAYRKNCCRIPSITGRVIPEPVYSIDAYHTDILQTIFRDLAPHDPEGLLQAEWANARGAIARFERGTIEIRVLDIQECPAADIALLELFCAALHALTSERWSSLPQQAAMTVDVLEPILMGNIGEGQRTVITDPDYLAALGINGEKQISSQDLWTHLRERCLPTSRFAAPNGAPLDVILSEGNLSQRILKAAGNDIHREKLAEVYRELCDCLAQGRMLRV